MLSYTSVTINAGQSNSCARFFMSVFPVTIKYKKLLGKPGKNDILSAAMDAILKESPFNDNYGAPRMQIALLQKGIKAGIRRITRIMREHGWLHKPHRKPKGLTHVTTEIHWI